MRAAEEAATPATDPSMRAAEEAAMPAMRPVAERLGFLIHGGSTRLFAGGSRSSGMKGSSRKIMWAFCV
jgi:hypothetical protein